MKYAPDSVFAYFGGLIFHFSSDFCPFSPFFTIFWGPFFHFSPFLRSQTRYTRAEVPQTMFSPSQSHCQRKTGVQILKVVRFRKNGILKNRLFQGFAGIPLISWDTRCDFPSYLSHGRVINRFGGFPGLDPF
jgi:hypothetical protein